MISRSVIAVEMQRARKMAHSSGSLPTTERVSLAAERVMMAMTAAPTP
jgi:hypothetical protein